MVNRRPLLATAQGFLNQKGLSCPGTRSCTKKTNCHCHPPWLNLGQHKCQNKSRLLWVLRVRVCSDVNTQARRRLFLHRKLHLSPHYTMPGEAVFYVVFTTYTLITLLHLPGAHLLAGRNLDWLPSHSSVSCQALHHRERPWSSFQYRKTK